MDIWNREFECMPREELELLQLEKLKNILQRAYNNSKLYKDKFNQVGFTPQDISNLEDLNKLPFTVKDDFRDNYPFNMFCVPMNEVVRLHASSGTTGKLTVIGCTKNDLQIWSELVARMVTMAGVKSSDIAQVAFGYGLFTGAHGLHYGLEKVGATVIPISGGNSEKQLMLMKDFKTTVLVSTPTYALHLSEVAEQMGIDPKAELDLKVGLFGGEAFSEEYRKEIENRWGILATDNYGLSEIGGPGFSGECEHICGQHVAEDHYIVEIIDPETLQPVKPGEQGEVVITTLTKEALPVIRYRTKDISSLKYEQCACGRTTARLSKITGRTDDMLVIRGVNVFPSQIESVLVNIEGLAPHYQIIIYKKGFLDDIEIRVEVSENIFSDNYRQLEAVEESLKQQLNNTLSITPKIKLVEPNSIERSSGKAKRVIDLRK
ncbi:Coenzyme A ligase [Candidatus Syntrophocurvum alkaliphilum]|uniref:Phenylacetate-coenzyme A ligase n=1 Tax=Candidatus Syntrophocurvum alkaliphilum TaxID=2293317 RepID=A0A6I6DGA1_9FIRM|nr:phenylacetate--CoA ligase [Candidatus Syntrophocurvum alkaliphilum]QGT99554.1 Coenzyme A ligase [Candidatus Syntrophocurvum alkaliphilum]